MLSWFVVLLLSLGVILLAAELFTNGVEWVGYRLHLGQGVVGSVLAAVGTAMPETLIPVVAIIFFGEEAANDVGIGAILGAPFMLATLAMFVVGIAILGLARGGRRPSTVGANAVGLSRDITFFIGAYTLAVVAGFIDLVWLKWLIAAALVVAYVVYVLRHLADEAEHGSEPNALHTTHWLPRGHAHIAGRPLEHIVHHYFADHPLFGHRMKAEQDSDPDESRSPESITPLYFLGKTVPRLRMCLGQVLVALMLIVLGAHFFVQAVEHVSVTLGIPALILSLIVAPVATELPEKFNSVLWVRVRKDTLAMGNITGAMVFQSCIPTAIGIAFTHWAIGGSVPALISAATALVSAAIIFGVSRLRGQLSAWVLLIGGLFYAAYLGYLFLVVI